MSHTLVRPRTFAAGAALLAVVALTGCGEDAPTADAPAQAPSSAAAESTPTAETPETTTPSAEPTETATPTESEAAEPSSEPAPEEEADASAAKVKKGLTEPGTSLKFGETANVKIDYAGSTWIGGVKVTAFEKAPESDYKALGVRGDAGNVYYLRYDLTYLAGKTKFPPEGGQLGWSKLHPEVKQGQRVSMINNPGFDKCTTVVHDTDERKLEVGETAKNMCRPFLIEKGTLKNVVHEFYNKDKREYEIITWK